MNVVTRFAPSPTGYFHAGSYRTALFSWIFARQNKGKFILRIEDTDKERSKKEFEDNIIDSLKWLGLEYDEFYRQSDRTAIYKKYIEQLIASGYAYVSKETQTDEEKAGGAKGREEVIRFKNPGKKVAFDDLIRGRIEFDTTELGDFVIAKSMEEPVFHLVVVIDDLDMGVTHIIRGEDHISNTPRQILIFEALGAKPPIYAHIPLLLAADRSKLSKRNGAVPITDYRAKGYLPQAIVNYLTLLGWHPADDKEILTTDDIISQFSLERVQKGGAIFDEEKLKWFNRQYIVKLSDQEFAAHAASFLPKSLPADSDAFKRAIPLLRDKIMAFGELKDMLSPEGELGFIHGLHDYVPSLLLWKKNPDEKAAQTHLMFAQTAFEKLPDHFSPDEAKAALWSYAEQHGRGDVLWPVRVALTGKEKSPDPFSAASILGKHESLKRVAAALRKLA